MPELSETKVRTAVERVASALNFDLIDVPSKRRMCSEQKPEGEGFDGAAVVGGVAGSGVG